MIVWKATEQLLRRRIRVVGKRFSFRQIGPLGLSEDWSLFLVVGEEWSGWTLLEKRAMQILSALSRAGETLLWDSRAHFRTEAGIILRREGEAWAFRGSDTRIGFLITWLETSHKCYSARLHDISGGCTPELSLRRTSNDRFLTRSLGLIDGSFRTNARNLDPLVLERDRPDTMGQGDEGRFLLGGGPERSRT
ncbi:hypothetical protein VTK26DRAFT_7870 [Humicola hyalothermophila]